MSQALSDRFLPHWIQKDYLTHVRIAIYGLKAHRQEQGYTFQKMLPYRSAPDAKDFAIAVRLVMSSTGVSTSILTTSSHVRRRLGIVVISMNVRRLGRWRTGIFPKLFLLVWSY